MGLVKKFLYCFAGIFIYFSLYNIPAVKAASLSYKEIDFYDNGTPSGYDYIDESVAVFNTDYWHYSGGYWLDGMKKEDKIYDIDNIFWYDPEFYYNRPGMNIMAEGILPESVKNYLAEGFNIIVSVIPRKPDAINMSQIPTYTIDGNHIFIKALPLFKISAVNRYPQFVPDLNKYIPIVRDGYGWNVYAIYRNGVHIGELPSSFTPDPNAIEFTEILDASGRLKSDKTFNIFNTDTGIITQARADEITIGDGTFFMAGAVGMWFTYEFDVRFYKYKPGDIETVEIKSPNRVEAGKDTICVATVKNNTTISYIGESAPILRLWDGRDNYETVTELSPGESKDVRIPWTVPDTPGIVDITVTINPDKLIEETDYSNNSANREVLIVALPSPAPSATPAPVATPRPAPVPVPVPPPDPGGAAIPDLAVTGFRETNYTTLSAVKSFVKISYTGAAGLRGVPVVFNDGEVTQRKLVDFSPREVKEVEFEWLTPQTPGVVSVTAEINPERTASESDYTNNIRSWDVRIDAPPVDLSLTSIIPSGYPAGKQVVTLINVKNDGNRDFTGNELVDIKFSVPSIGFSSVKRISIAKNADSAIPFFWTAPASAGLFQIAAEVNPSRAISETDYLNNTISIEAESTITNNPPFGCNISRRDWTERRLTGGEYISILAPDGTSRLIYVPIFETISFYAEVSINARLVPGTIKSGYGVECEVTTYLNTNYDMPNGVIPLQDVYAYLPTTNYTQAIKLEPAPGATNRWRFPINPSSVIGARVQYIPVEWPDGSAFQIGFTARDAQCPGGSMCVTAYAQVQIDGNMYEDDYTAPQ